MHFLKFEQTSEGPIHTCDSIRDGEWIVFYCPKCKGFERRINWRTGEMNKKNTDTAILHQGEFMPIDKPQYLFSNN